MRKRQRERSFKGLREISSSILQWSQWRLHIEVADELINVSFDSLNNCSLREMVVGWGAWGLRGGPATEKRRIMHQMSINWKMDSRELLSLSER